jgi:hypothetical protein
MGSATGGESSWSRLPILSSCNWQFRAAAT